MQILNRINKKMTLQITYVSIMGKDATTAARYFFAANPPPNHKTVRISMKSE